jgi:hypothetical protein
LDLVCGAYIGGNQQQSFRCSHPFYHHGLRANQSQLTHWGGHRYPMLTNSLAFRDRQIRSVPLQSDGPRVVLIGDSMIEGLGVAYEKTVAGQLEKRWNALGVEVLNAGVVSYSPHLYHLRVRHLIEELGLQFTHLVVFIDISDIQDETFYQDFQPASGTSKERGWWRRHSLVARVFEPFVSPQPRTNNQFRTDAEVNVWMEGTDAYHAGTDPEIGRWEWTISDDIYEQWGKQGLALAREHMIELNELCRKHQIGLTVVIYPSPVQIFAKDKDSRQVRFWREFCEQFDLTLIDLWPTFFDDAYAGPGEIYKRFFLFSDMHWNELGSELVAEKVDAAIGTTITLAP